MQSDTGPSEYQASTCVLLIEYLLTVLWLVLINSTDRGIDWGARICTVSRIFELKFLFELGSVVISVGRKPSLPVIY